MPGTSLDRKTLVSRAKAILAEAYEEAAELVAEYVEQTGEALQSLCKEIDPDNWNGLRQRVQRAQARREASSEAESAARARETERKRRSHAKETLKDPEQRRQVIASLSEAELDEVHAEAGDALVERARARRAEHDTDPKVGDLMGDEPFDPGAMAIDTPLISLYSAADRIQKRIERHGLRLLSLSEENAFGKLSETERIVAEARVILQERLQDREVAQNG